MTARVNYQYIKLSPLEERVRTDEVLRIIRTALKKIAVERELSNEKEYPCRAVTKRGRMQA